MGKKTSLPGSFFRFHNWPTNESTEAASTGMQNAADSISPKALHWSFPEFHVADRVACRIQTMEMWLNSTTCEIQRQSTSARSRRSVARDGKPLKVVAIVGRASWAEHRGEDRRGAAMLAAILAGASPARGTCP